MRGSHPAVNDVIILIGLLSIWPSWSQSMAADAERTNLSDGEKASLKSTSEKPRAPGDGPVEWPIVLSDVQGGFAGFTGRVWTIERDGSWRRQRYRNRPTGRPDQQGRLTRSQVAALVNALTEHDLMGLPETIGEARAPNPHLFTLAGGGKKSTLRLGAGQPLPPYDPEAGPTDPRNRFVSAVRAILAPLAPAETPRVPRRDPRD